jgi:hypothetical protein
MKIRRFGAKLFHADGRTNMTKLFVTFRTFANGPEKRTYEQEIMPPYHFVRYETCIDIITTATNRLFSFRRYSVTTKLSTTERRKTCNRSRQNSCMSQLLGATQTLQFSVVIL